MSEQYRYRYLYESSAWNRYWYECSVWYRYRYQYGGIGGTLVEDTLWWETTFDGGRPPVDPCMLPSPLCGIFPNCFPPKGQTICLSPGGKQFFHTACPFLENFQLLLTPPLSIKPFHLLLRKQKFILNLSQHITSVQTISKST